MLIVLGLAGAVWWDMFSARDVQAVNQLYDNPDQASDASSTALVSATGTIPAAIDSSDEATITPPSTSHMPATTTTPAPSYQFASDNGYGISLADTLSGLSDSALEAELADIASLGVTWIRIDLDWSVIQRRGSSQYDWSNADRVIAAAEAHGLRVLPILVYTPRWARIPNCNSNRCPPADASQFANFADAAVQRFAPLGVHQWEIWNEENTAGSWMPQASPAAFVALLKAAYGAIKKDDPNATVITGGLAPIATGDGNIAQLDYLTELYADGAKDYFDAVGFHPYSFPVTPDYDAPWNAWHQMAETAPSVRSIMAANNDSDKKIWITEYGAPTGGPGQASSGYVPDQTTDYVTEDLQALMAADAIDEVKRDSWAGPLFWYSYKDIGTSDSTTENFFGLVRFDGSHKPAYDSLKKALH